MERYSTKEDSLSNESHRILDQKVDNVQQNKNNIRLMGLKESDKEDLWKEVDSLIKNKMYLNRRSTDISSIYRVDQSQTMVTDMS